MNSRCACVCVCMCVGVRVSECLGAQKGLRGGGGGAGEGGEKDSRKVSAEQL